MTSCSLRLQKQRESSGRSLQNNLRLCMCASSRPPVRLSKHEQDVYGFFAGIGTDQTTHRPSLPTGACGSTRQARPTGSWHTAHNREPKKKKSGGFCGRGRPAYFCLFERKHARETHRQIDRNQGSSPRGNPFRWLCRCQTLVSLSEEVLACSVLP